MITSGDSFRIRSRDFRFTDHSLDEINQEIFEVNQLAEEVGGVFYPGADDSRTLVLFAGYMEKFATLSFARYVSCNVLALQDVSSPWYQGSSTLPPILDLTRILEDDLKNQKLYLFGQASGAYAALVASKNLTEAKIIAVSPHSFSDADLKRRIRFGAGIAPCVTPDGLLDLVDFLHDADESSDRVVICSSSETNNPARDYFWLDHLHALRLAHLSAVRVFVANSTRHSFAFQNAQIFATTLQAAIHSRDTWDAIMDRCLFNISVQPA
ncbi:hypothetical protein [Ensifer sp. ENS03]|uniref:hypothetical protein n=1 Tax=Ensifer sp. ENS03 TaxID=2769283 RepID=UPI0017802DF1|nr:hypothetical protein [Ensifer sp. ENS03]MBD9559611.1 hypothetical protein [Ensifer sp. ENS03]